jgi:hypothetical protein
VVRRHVATKNKQEAMEKKLAKKERKQLERSQQNVAK